MQAKGLHSAIFLSSILQSPLGRYFHLSQKEAAARYGLCLTSFKKLCKSRGVVRWPFRQIRSVERKLHNLQQLSQRLQVLAPSLSVPTLLVVHAICW